MKKVFCIGIILLSLCVPQSLEDLPFLVVDNPVTEAKLPQRPRPHVSQKPLNFLQLEDPAKAIFSPMVSVSHFTLNGQQENLNIRDVGIDFQVAYNVRFGIHVLHTTGRFYKQDHAPMLRVGFAF